MGPRTVGVLALVALALAAYYYLFERDPPRGRQIGPAFPTLEFPDVEELELKPGQMWEASGAKSDGILLKKKSNGEWWIQRPNVPAHVPRVESIIWSLIELQRISDVPLSEESKVFDRRGPEVTLRFRTRSGEEHEIEVGLDHPEDQLNLFYARLDHKKLFLASMVFKKNLNSRLDDLRSRALFPVAPERAIRLEVSGEPLYRMVLNRVGDSDAWRLESPEPAPASRQEVVRLLEELNAWEAESFVRDEPGDLKPFGLDKPRTAIALTDQDRNVITLQIGNEVPREESGDEAKKNKSVYVRWADKPFVMTASASPAEEVERPPEFLYSKYVLQIGSEEIQTITVSLVDSPEKNYVLRASAPKAQARLVREIDPVEVKESHWEVEELSKKLKYTADRDRIRRLLDSLQYLLVKKYVPKPAEPPPPESGLSRPEVKLEILSDTGGRHVLSFFPSPQDGKETEQGVVYVSADEEPFFFQVSCPILDSLIRGGLWFRNRQISRLKSGTLREFQVSLRDSDGEHTWSLGRPRETWSLGFSDHYTIRDGRILEQERVRKVAEMLEQDSFRVWEWSIEKPDLEEEGIADTRFRVRITLTQVEGDDQGFRRLYIGQEKLSERAPVVQWARVDTPELEDLPFYLDRTVANLIFELTDHLKELTEPVK